MDTYIPENNLPVPDFIKIDAECAEDLILQGADDLFNQCSPIIFLELNQPTMATFNTSGLALMKRLQKKGYNYFKLITLDGIYIVDEHNLNDLLDKYFSPNLLAQKLMASSQ